MCIKKIKSQVRLKESKNYFAMKVLSKQEMIARNKVRVPVGLNKKKTLAWPRAS